MMYLGPQEAADAPAPLADELPMREVLTRSATEIESLREAVGELEWMVVSNPALVENAELRKILQSIDPIQQSLQALEGFLGAVAQQPCPGATSVQAALEQVRLEGIRNRLGRAP